MGHDGPVLTELRIRNVGVIDDVTLHFGPGLNVLTGETGAGKTMVVSALQWLLGARADGDRIRSGTGTAVVEGSVSPAPPEAAEWLDEGDDELIVGREVSSVNGASRSRARLGGRMAPVSALAACVGAVVELHGQSDTSRLVAPAVQRDLLDRFGGPSLADAASAYRRCFDEWTAARRELDELKNTARTRVREADRLRFELDEIDAVGPVQGEAETLAADLGRLEHAEALTVAAAAGAAAVSDDGGARDALATAVAAVHGAAGFDPALDALADRLASLLAEAEDVGLELQRYATGLESDPSRLESLRERQAGLVRLSRKYGDVAPGEMDIAGVVAYATTARQELARLESGDERTAELEAEVARLADALDAEAQRLRGEREAAGKRLAEVVDQHLAELAMEGAHLDVAVEPVEFSASGADRVTFLLAANRGEPALPFGKAASGGERSRVALALRLALADADDTAVLVFDEVDAGIGGATANAVGRKLASLAAGRQVLCVTHLAQLAAHADTHFSVVKEAAGERTAAQVRPLDEAARLEELARMLSGTDSAAAAEHAAEMLANARAPGGSGGRRTSKG